MLDDDLGDIDDDFAGGNYEDDLDDNFNPEDELNENFDDLIISDAKGIKGDKITTTTNDQGKNNLTVSVKTTSTSKTEKKEETTSTKPNEKNEVKTEGTEEKPKKKTGLASLFD